MENKHVVVLELGPSTLLVLAQSVLITLKFMGYLTIPWTLVLIPILMVSGSATILILISLIKLLRKNFF